MSLFVTGGAGFVGMNLVEALVQAGERVRVLHRARSRTERLARMPVELVEGEITDPAALEAALPEGVDVLYHVAANTNLWSKRNERQTRDNVEGTRNVVRAALTRRVRRLVHVSSIAAFGIHDGRIDESTSRDTSHDWINYVRTKAAAEDEVRRGLDAGLDAVIVNPASVIGPHDTRSWAHLIRLAHRGRLPGVPPGRGSFAHSREVARALIAAAERGRRGENYLLGGADASHLEVVRVVSRLAGREPPRRTTPGWLLRATAAALAAAARVSGRPPVVTPEAAALACATTLCRSDKAIRELGYRPVPLDVMVEDAWRWLRGQGLLD